MSSDRTEHVHGHPGQASTCFYSLNREGVLGPPHQKVAYGHAISFYLLDREGRPRTYKAFVFVGEGGVSIRLIAKGVLGLMEWERKKNQDNVSIRLIAKGVLGRAAGRAYPIHREFLFA